MATAVTERGALAGAGGGKGGAKRELRRGGSETCGQRSEREPRAPPGCCPAERGELRMGKKWRDAAEMERGGSDREDGGESRRCSRNASRGRLAESWKRLSSKQGSTKRSGLPSQQTPVSGPGGNPPGSLLPFLSPHATRALSMVLNLPPKGSSHGTCGAASHGGKESGGCEEGREGMTSLSSATESLLTSLVSLQKMGNMLERRGAHGLIIRVWRVCDAVEGIVVTQVPVLGIFLCSMFGGTRQPLN